MGYFLNQGKETIFTDPYKAVSPTASIIIETADFKSFLNSVTTGKGFVGEAGNIRNWEVFNKKLKYITDQINRTEFSKLINDNAAVISFQQGEKGNFQVLLSIAVPAKVRYRHLKEILQASGINEFTENRVAGNYILKIPYKITRSDTVFVSLVSGLILCSNSDSLLEESILQTRRNTDIRDSEGFSRVFLASGKNEDKVFVVFANLQKLAGSLLGKEGSGIAEKISKLAGAAGADIFISEDGLVLSGYTESTDSSDFLFKYKTMPSRPFQTYKILPASTVLFETLIIHENSLPYDSNLFFSDEKVRPADIIRQYIGDEVTRAIVDIKRNLPGDNFLFIYELLNPVEAESVFLNALGQEKETINYTPDDQTSIPVYKISLNSTDSLQRGSAGQDDLFFTFYNNFLVSGKSYATVTRLLYDNLLNKTLANDLTYRDFESTLPTIGDYFFYCIPSRISNYLGQFLSDELNQAIQSNRVSLNKISAAGWSFSSSNNMIYNSLSIRFREKAKEESSTEWETLLDTVAGIKPFFFTNHISGAKEIFIQDLNNRIYLINSAGRVLWKVSLNEKIEGTVYMIDYFRNGKYQLLFAGRNFLHMIDRNGNYVERYPVKLRSPATNQMALFDYDNNLDYRIFIAGEDNLIYSYEKNGNVVKGWKPFKTRGTVRSEVNHFRISGKDYIVVSDESTMYFLDRTGNKRINLTEPVKKASGSSIKLNLGKKPSVTCSSPDGTIKHIFFDGSIEGVNIKSFSANHKFDIFDVDGDGFGEYIFIDGDMLYLYNRNNTELFSRKFDSSNLGGPLNFIFSASDRKIGVIDLNNKLIYLLDKDGETMNGFPLMGASFFSIGKLVEKSGWNLIVGGTDRFLYNYKIDGELKVD
jgi:hypothetical protein